MINLESQLLIWLSEESDQRLKDQGPEAVAVRLLVLRLALHNRAADHDLTHSVELSLGAFERAEVYRYLRQLARRELIQFVDSQGQALRGQALQEMLSPEAPDKLAGFVALTPPGRLEAERLLKVRRTVLPGKFDESGGSAE